MMSVLPRVENVVIPVEKFTEYILDPMKSRGKWLAFRDALGYTKRNVHDLITEIRQNLIHFPAESKGDYGYGETYAVLMELSGVHGKKTLVMTAWIDDRSSGEMRLTSAYVKKRKAETND